MSICVKHNCGHLVEYNTNGIDMHSKMVKQSLEYLDHKDCWDCYSGEYQHHLTALGGMDCPLTGTPLRAEHGQELNDGIGVRMVELIDLGA